MTTAASDLDTSHFHHTPFYCEENVYLLCKKLCADGVADGSDLFVVFISNEKKQIALWHQKASKRADGIVLWDYHVICIQIKSGGDPPLVWDLDSSLPFPSPLASYVSETIRPSFQLFPDYLSYGFVSRKLVSIKFPWDDPMGYDLMLLDMGPGEGASNFLLNLHFIESMTPCMVFIPGEGASNFLLNLHFIELFRIVHAPIFLQCFASDRRHMRDSDGNWSAEPPQHEPIVAEDGTVNNLNEYFNISAAEAMTDASINSFKEAVFTQKYGVVIKENQLEEIFSQISLQ